MAAAVTGNSGIQERDPLLRLQNSPSQPQPALAVQGQQVWRKWSSELTSPSFWIPELNPRPWLLINGILALWSWWLFLQIVVPYYFEDPVHRRFRNIRYGLYLYLIWNLCSSIVWCVEVVGTCLYHTHHGQQQDRVLPSVLRRSDTATPCSRLTWYDKMQLPVALYFVVDSYRLLVAWHVNKSQIASNLVEAFVSGVAYTVQFGTILKGTTEGNRLTNNSVLQEEILIPPN
jgi:hypothetical protein